VAWEAGREAFSAESAVRALALSCEDAGLDGADARLVRMGENAIYALPRENVVARIARSVVLIDRVQRELNLGNWLAALGYPAVRPADMGKQPIEVEGRLVTFWDLVPHVDGEASPADLGILLREFHALPPPPFALPRFDPFSAVPQRLAEPGDAPPQDVALLAERYRVLSAAYQATEFPTPFGLIHGDAHRGNVLMSPDGPLLSDFDVVAYGPREWDLTPTAFAVDRFGLPYEAYVSFAEAYGRDVREWPGFAVLGGIREITMTTWLMQLYGVSDAHAAEFRLRVNALREGNHDELWHAVP
jgi:hypothetical protein